MKTSIYTIALCALLISGFSAVSNTIPGDADKIKRNIPVAPRETFSENFIIPGNLAFIKARNAFVPTAPLIIGSPSDQVVELMIISPKLFLGDASEAPIELSRIMARNAFVPLAPVVQGNAQADIPKDL